MNSQTPNSNTAPRTSSHLRCVALRKRYMFEGKEIEVLQGVDLEIEAGARVSLTGPSGSGKSTFLHLAGTLDRPTSGQIFFGDAELTAMNSAALARFRNHEMGFVFQFHHLLPEFSALENVALPGMIQRLPTSEAEARAEAALAHVGLASRLGHRPGELSGGEQQRVAIARALVMRPKILFADEPTGNLDERAAMGIYELLEQMNQELGITLVFVTHSTQLAARFPRRLQMREGRLVEGEGERGAAVS